MYIYIVEICMLAVRDSDEVASSDVADGGHDLSIKPCEIHVKLSSMSSFVIFTFQSNRLSLR
jgi:hypothetical protein